MSLDILKTIITKVAPILGTAIGGPIGGILTGLIASAFGGDSNNTEDLAAKIQADPDAEIKLKSIEAQIAQIHLSAYQSQLNDVQNARERQLEVIKSTGKQDFVVNALAFAIPLGFFASMYIIMTTTMDQSDHDVLYSMIGVLGAKFSDIISYFYGSSKK